MKKSIIALALAALTLCSCEDMGLGSLTSLLGSDNSSSATYSGTSSDSSLEELGSSYSLAILDLLVDNLKMLETALIVNYVDTDSDWSWRYDTNGKDLLDKGSVWKVKTSTLEGLNIECTDASSAWKLTRSGSYSFPSNKKTTLASLISSGSSSNTFPTDYTINCTVGDLVENEDGTPHYNWNTVYSGTRTEDNNLSASWSGKVSFTGGSYGSWAKADGRIVLTIKQGSEVIDVAYLDLDGTDKYYVRGL